MTTTETKMIDFEQGWGLVETGITKLLNILKGHPEEPFNSESYMKIYTTIYNMCCQGGSDNYSGRLYDEYTRVFETHCVSTILPSLRENHAEVLLQDFVDRWALLQTMVRWMFHFFSYIDRFYTPRTLKPGLKVIPVNCFRELVYKEVNVRVRDAVIGFIRKEREGEQINRALLKNVLGVFVAMGTKSNLMEYYELGFEAAMFEDTVDYYSRKAASWVGEDSCPCYMIKAEECLTREKERVSHYLCASSEVELLKKAEHELLTVHRNQLLEKEHSGCLALLRDDKVEDLARMYRLFGRVPDGLNPIASMFKDHITAQGTMLVEQAEEAARNRKPGKIDVSNSHEQVFIEEVIQLHDKYHGLVKDCFLSHTLLEKAFKEAFEVFCNKTIARSSSAEILSIFCDNIMKRAASEKLGDEAIEETFDKVAALLAYFSDKDLFAEFSRKKLARRLLLDRTANVEYERSFLTKLKHVYGAQFTSKMEGMVTDLILSRESQADFEAYLNNSQQQKHHLVDLTVTVLTTSFWPTYKSSDLNLPAEMVKCVETFKEFYGAKTNQRKLSWIYSLGCCNIIGKFETKSIELIVTTYQASLLILFNESDQLSYSEIKNQLNLSDEDVARLLHSLSCAKYKILTKEPNTKTISPNDIFEFNCKFTDKMRRIKIPLPPVDDKKKVIEDVNNDRRLTIDAFIVRIMKGRKVLGHQQLVMECVEQLSKMFKPDVKLIKKRIDDLITRDFLERDPANPNIYNYLA